MAIVGSPSLDHVILPMIARAGEVLRGTRERGDALGGVVALIVAARIIEADMRACIEGQLDPHLMQQLEAEARRAVEEIFTSGWARH